MGRAVDDAARPRLAHAGVHVPPPLVYVAGLVSGWLLERWRPWPIPGLATTRVVIATVGVALWLVLTGGALGLFRRARTTFLPNRSSSVLVTTGPYRLTRNPMYLGLAALYLGIAFWLASWWPVLLFPAVIVIIDRFVIVREERYLSAAFPEAYAAYRARVRRWL